jgi:hypothetical protein
MSVHKVAVRMSLGKLVPLGCPMALVQPVQDMWNVVIAKARHEEEISASSSR